MGLYQSLPPDFIFIREQRYCCRDRNIRRGESIAGNPGVESRRQHGAGKIDLKS